MQSSKRRTACIRRRPPRQLERGGEERLEDRGAAIWEGGWLRGGGVDGMGRGVGDGLGVGRGSGRTGVSKAGSC